MNNDGMQKALETLGKGVIHVAGDLVVEKHVEYEVNNVEAGGIGIQINNGSPDTPLTVADKDVRDALLELQEARDEGGGYILHDKAQWYAIFRVLSQKCGYPAKLKDFERTMLNIGAGDMRVACSYESMKKVAVPNLPERIDLWPQFVNSADRHSLKQLKVAVKLMEIMHLK